MRAVEFVRAQLTELGWPMAPVELRRDLTNAVKAALRRGDNPRTVVARLCQERLPRKAS